MKKKKKRIIIIAGGTGGHLFPAITLYKNCLNNSLDTYLISDKRSLKYKEKLAGIENLHITSIKPKSSGRFIFFFSAIISVIQSFCIFFKIKPDLIVSFGSYVSVPPMLIAAILNKNMILHESNAVIGKAIKLFMDCRKNIILSTGFPIVTDSKGNRIITDKYIHTENIVEKNVFFDPILNLEDKFTICIFGGSQGSDFIDKTIPSAILKLADKNNVKIIQQCKKENISLIKSIYDEKNIEYDIREFFNDLNCLIRTKVHLVICRSGAQTVTEITKMGKIVLYIPYPYAVDNHQLVNAKSIKGSKEYVDIIMQDNTDIKNITRKIQYVIDNFASLSKLIREDTDKNKSTSLLSLILNLNI
ncbi:UDP-N-acetylglucosamine--N-acetylmuramyl-(pentapeptide) pyrophosphoryl-undecaprenol N-acetylglucosamine transferase [Anaplasmataceae bacterium AB001_6]|nr:UDP-N-acetylglucosamine--N-acetylmuramyl-(pentapeptide) pyrophosphoryl-undecaprenol N-acetylglucosamine transferase [Anaplasmataceae bacterium AB001_6]